MLRRGGRTGGGAGGGAGGSTGLGSSRGSSSGGGGGRGDGSGAVDGELTRVRKIGTVGDQDGVFVTSGEGGGDLDGGGTGLVAVQVTDGGQTGDGDLESTLLLLQDDGESGVGEVAAVVLPGNGLGGTGGPDRALDRGGPLELVGRGDGNNGGEGDESKLHGECDERGEKGVGVGK